MTNKLLWETLTYPVIGLSPMDGITDHPFRHITKKYGHPPIVYTEFTSVEGVCHGAKQILRDYLYDETQRPIIAQIYGTTPDFFRQTAIILCELGFDAIDINMGCPAKNVAHSGAGAALIKTPDLAQKIIAATKQGVQEYWNGERSRNCPNVIPTIWREVEKRSAAVRALQPNQQLPAERCALPVSVKTRIGYSHPVIEEWIPTLLEMEPAVIALHGRTLQQQYSGLADWDEIAKGAELAKKTQTRILGNGDVTSYDDAQQRITQYNLDGVLIGQASMGNPYIFCPTTADFTQKPILEIAIEHAQLFETIFGTSENYSFLPMRKHLGWYAKNFANAKQLRIGLLQTQNSQAAEAHINDWLRHYSLAS